MRNKHYGFTGRNENVFKRLTAKNIAAGIPRKDARKIAAELIEMAHKADWKFDIRDLEDLR